MPARRRDRETMAGKYSYREQESHGLTTNETNKQSNKQSPPLEKIKKGRRRIKNIYKNFFIFFIFWVNYQSRAVVLMREKREKNFDEE